GTIVTDSLGGYTWYKNSRLNRLTAWENSPSFDIPGDTVYIKNMENGSVWSVALNPRPDTKNYNTILGFGYNKYLHRCQGIDQELTVFVPKEDSVKVEILKLKNTTPTKKKIKVYYYAKPVLGEDEIKTSKYINLDFDRNNNIIIARNLYNNEIDGYSMYLSCSEKINSYTGDKNLFLGNGGLQNPDGISKIKLNNENSLGKSSCIAYEVDVELESFEEKEISIVLGAEDSVLDCKNISYKYSKLQNCKQELEIVKNYWKNLLGRCEVKTPLESMNIILNGWAAYQTISSRLLARSGFYQSGGAFGFRDQLQDTFGLKYLDPEILKKQILKHSEHQFIEGDVEHWWHDETKRGIRTRFSDDLLWLPYAVAEYINFTGDKSILDTETSYLQGKQLQENQDEKYDLYLPSEIKESIYLHAKKAIEKSLNFGENGLPKIGSGDWNDGFSTVGNKGKGESVWLGFFLYSILEKFIPICKEKGDIDLVEKYEKVKQDLKHALNTNAWDGRWYKRAFMDDGNTLGSMENDECR
ncbi:MAG: glycosyl transferase, partial [Clostridia bacterium]|nr:glycosyl transferase [Clostridia bacterium]